MTDRELMQQALEALENNLDVMKADWDQIDQEWGPSEGGLQAAIDGTLTGYEYFKDTISVITALRERLAQPEQTVSMDEYKRLQKLVTSQGIRLMEYESAQPEQEPFCYHDGRNIVGKEYSDHSDVFPLYTVPQPRQWQGLTDEEKAELDAEYGDDTLAHLDAIEAKLREKNA